MLTVKTIFLTLTLSALLSLSAVAEEEEETFCERIAKIAEVAHEMRYNNISLANALRTIGDYQLGRKIIIEAYELPRYGTDQYILQDRRDLSDKWHIACIKQQG